MKFMLMMRYEGGTGCDVPMGQWPAADIEAHIRFHLELDRQLTDSGELVLAEGLAAPQSAKIVTANGHTAPVVSGWPLSRPREFLAGFWIVDVADEERALQIAALASAAPALGGEPIQQRIEVRALAEPPIERD